MNLEGIVLPYVARIPNYPVSICVTVEGYICVEPLSLDGP